MRGDLERVPVIDDVVVERLLTLRDQVSKPGEDVLGELLSLFARDTTLRIAALRTAIAGTDRKACADAAHALKGSAGNVGAQRVAAIAAHVEKSGATADEIDWLEGEVASAVQALERRLLAPSADPVERGRRR